MTADMPPDAFDSFVQDPEAAVRRWAQPMLAPLQSEIAQLRQQKVQNYMDQDVELGSRWRAVNNDPAFIRWLGDADELSGARRLELLRRAYDLGDADRVRWIFAAYLRSLTPATKAAAPAPFDPRRRQPTLRPDGQRVYSRADIAKFYADKRAGLYDGREAEAIRIERDIVAAAAGNRVSDPPMRIDP